MVWHDQTQPNSPRLMASMVAQNGTVSAPFAISAAVGKPQPMIRGRAQIAFDGSSNWLVVWSDDRSVGPGVHGAIVATNGTILGGSDFLIATTPGTIPEQPIVEFDGNNFVVAWMSTPAGSKSGSQIYFTHITSSGKVLPPAPLPGLTEQIDRTALFLSTQKPRGDTLLVYRDSVAAQTRAARIAPDGALRGVATLSGDGFGDPLAAEFVDGAWQILSSPKGSHEIYLHTLSIVGTLTPPNGVFAKAQTVEVSAGASGWILLGVSQPSDLAHLTGKRVGFDGRDYDPVPFQIDSGLRNKITHAATDQAGDQFLTVWFDSESKRISGALNEVTIAGVQHQGLVPLVNTSPAIGPAPVTVNFDSTGSAGNYDTLQWNFGDGTTSNLPIVSHTYRVNGTYIAQLQLTRGAQKVFQTVEVAIGASSQAPTTPHIGIPLENSPEVGKGSFLVSKFSAQEQNVGKNASAHMYSIKGQIARKQGLYQLAPDGQIELRIGTYTFSLPASKFVTQNGSIKYAAKPGSPGIKKLSINQRTGVFDLQLLGIPAGGSGLPVGEDPTKVDLNLSIKMDLKDGALRAGRYLYILRKDSRARGWKLR
jgi:hypothetical protein